MRKSTKQIPSNVIKDQPTRQAFDHVQKRLAALESAVQQQLYVEGDSAQSTLLSVTENFPPHLILTVKANGKPFRLEVVPTFPPASLAAPESFEFFANNVNNFVIITWYRDDKVIISQKLGVWDQNSGATGVALTIPCQIMSIVENPTIDTHTYKVSINLLGGVGTLGPSKLIAYNIG